MKNLFSKMMVASLALALSSICLMGCELTVKDADGNVYPTMKIGQQIWMAKNLNVNVEGSMCYDNDPANCEKYGRLYTWEAAKKACPAGWHLPSADEIVTFLNAAAVRVDQIVTKKKLDAVPLKEGEDKFSYHLQDTSWGDGFDTFGFSALPAGHYHSGLKKFGTLGATYFWSSSEIDEDSAYALDIYGYAGVSSYSKYSGHSVRCLKDSNEEREASLARPSGAGAATAQNLGTMKDSRDGQTYRTVKIGDQTWMAENLNYKVNDGKQSWCYDNKKSNCEKYGRLYTWAAAQKVCPSGWHLPSKEDFESLLDKVRLSEEGSSANLRAPSWAEGKDKYGFSALPAGRYNSYFKEFDSLRYRAYFWSSTEDSERHAYYLGIYARAGVNSGNKPDGDSVRCLKDN